MEHPWVEFWDKTAETLGIAAAFSFMGAGFLLWATPEQHSRGRGLTVIMGGQILNAATTAFVHGYLGWSIFIAPVLGLACGLISVPILMAVIKVGQEKAGDLVKAGIEKITGQETKP